MNEIKIYLKPSGSTAELYKDFNLYQGSYRNVQISIYVPTSVLYKNANNTFYSTVQTGAIITAPNGAKVPTLSNSTDYVKTEVVNNVEYAVYTQIMPKEYAMYAGTQIIVCNVVNVDNTDETKPKIISVITTQRAPLVVLESAYLSKDEPLDPSESEVIEGLINNLKELLLNGYYASRAMYAWNSTYTYGAGELVFYPEAGEYGVFIKSLIDDNNNPPYNSDGNLNTQYWELITDFNILASLYDLRDEVTEALQDAQTAAQSAQQSADTATSQASNAQQSALNAENSAQRVEDAADYLADIQSGAIAVPKATSDTTGTNIATQFATITSDIQGLREDISNESHFRGMFDSLSALQTAYPTATPNDYAYIVGGNQRIYQDGAWTDSGEPTPNTAVPRGTVIPLMDGEGSAGTSSAYAPEDHRHPSDTNKANTSGYYPNMSVGASDKLKYGININGITSTCSDADGSVLNYGSCPTSTSARIKVVACNRFLLAEGARITVKFTNANTVSSPALNVNDTDARPIKADGDMSNVRWLAGAVMDFVYDGIYWVCIGGYQLAGMRVGFVYTSNNSTSPATLFGGSWTNISGRFLIGAGTTYPGGSTGGAATVSLTAAQNGQHHHTGSVYQFNTAYGNDIPSVPGRTVVMEPSATTVYYSSTTVEHTARLGGADTSDNGSGEAHENMPPYRAEYMWYRTA